MTQMAMGVETKLLPASWKWVQLEALALNQKGAFKIGPFGSSLKKAELADSGIPVCGIQDIVAGRLLPAFHRFVSEEKYKQLEQYSLSEGDILVTTMGTIGRAGVVPGGLGRIVYDSHLFRMRLNQSVADPEFICYAINGYRELQSEIRDKSTGSIMAGLNTTILKFCSIPLPPLSEQKRIAAILNEQMAAVEKAKQPAEERLEAAKVLPMAYLKEVFEGEDSRSWPTKLLGDVCNIVTGNTPSKSNPEHYGGDIPWVNPSRLGNSRYVVESDEYLTDSGLKLARIIPAGSVMVTCISGAIRHIGKASIAGRPLTTNQQVNALVPHDSVQSLFLYYAMQNIKPVLESLAASTNQNIVNKSKLSGVAIALPSYKEQERLSSGLDERISGSRTLEESIREELDTIEAIPSALLRKAFSGAL